MAQIAVSFTQPTSSPPDVQIFVEGDPILVRDEVVHILNYGYYLVLEVVSEAVPSRRYRVRLIQRDFPAINTVPVGAEITVTRDGVTHSALPFNSTIALSFREDDYRTLNLTGDIQFNAQHHSAAKSISVVIRNNQVTHAMSFPPSWIWLGAVGKPTQIAAGKTGVLSITCLGTSDADVIAVWSAQA